VAGLPFRLGLCHLLTGIRGHHASLLGYRSDQELNKNGLWCVDTILDVTI